MSTKHRAKLIPALGGGKEDPPELLWRVLLFNAVTKAEIENAFAYGRAHPDEEAAPTDDVDALLRTPPPSAFLGAFVEDEHPREHGRFVSKDGGGGMYDDFTAIETRTIDNDTKADAAARVAATIELEKLLPDASINLGTLRGDLAPQLVESVQRAVDEFPALPGAISGIQVTEMTHGTMGGYMPGSGEMVFNSENFGTSALDGASSTRDTSMQPSGSFHPLSDAQSTFDHEIGHAVWNAAQAAMSKDLDPHGIGGGWGRLTDKEMSMKLLGFDPDAVANKGFTGWQSPRKPESEWKVPTRSITAAMRSMGSKYGSLSYMADSIEGGYVETSRSLNEGFAEWFSVRQRESMRGELESRTKPIIGDAFSRVLGFAKVAKDLPAMTAAPAGMTGGRMTCYGYVSIAKWESMTKAEQRALFPPVDEAQLAYVEGQARDTFGRFGEGGDAGRSVLQTVREQGGMTVSPLDASSPKTGYVVARPDVKGEIMKADDFFDPAKGPAAIVAFMEKNPTAFDESGEYLGLWHDTAHNEVALDAVEVIEDRGAAEAAGRDRDEQAIWDVAGGQEISTGGTGHRAAAANRLRGSHGRPSAPPRQAAEAVGRDDGRRENGVGDPGAAGDGGAGGLSSADARVIQRLTALRQQLGTRLLAAAQQAYEQALRSAGVKLVGRARARTSPTRQRQAIAAVDGREALAPWLAAVGLTEEDMLAHAFDTFTELTIVELGRYRERQAALVARLSVDVPLPESPPVELIADYLVAGLTAMARARLRIGDRAMVAATLGKLAPLTEEMRKKLAEAAAREAAKKAVKRALPQHEDNFDLPAGLPDPDELASAAARLVRNALFSADGRVHPQLPATPDRLPTVVITGDEMAPTIEEKLVLDFTVAPVWRWQHGFYGEPLRPFDPHEALDGYETTERDSDPNLFNGEAWPPTDLFAPGDHEGCTCEWTVAVDES